MNKNEDRALRPTSFDGYLGQESSKKLLQISIKAARQRGEPITHTLMSGPPGLGKTTLAQIIANEMGAKMITINSPSIRHKGELVSILLSLEPRDILFLDEIHSLNPKIEEILYPAMEDFKIVVLNSDANASNAMEFSINPFTLIGATTRSGMISQPLRDRFGEVIQMQHYSVEELAVIVQQSARKLGIECLALAALSISKMSRGTPRIANHLVRHARDRAQVFGSAVIDESTVRETADSIGIDLAGLNRTDREYLKILNNRKTASGIKTITSMLGESKDAVEEVIEPYLMRIGFIEKTALGRTITETGSRHLSQAG